MRIKISRKEARESEFWLELAEPLKEFEQEKDRFIAGSPRIKKDIRIYHRENKMKFFGIYDFLF